MFNMRSMTISAFIIVVILLTVFIAPASASHHAKKEKKAVTPYGDFCDRCSDYGTCDKPLTHEGAKKAVIEYYHKKGLNVMLEKNRGRFIKAKIMDKGSVVDVIILDRRTGRIRSIY